MRRLLAASDQNDPAIAPLHFALFKALDDLDQRARAFAHLEKANRLTKIGSGYDFQTDALPYALSKALIRVPIRADTPPPGLRPIFVTGLPRSGTTLVERILARAEGVQACGELTVVQVTVGRLLREIMTRANKSLSAEDIVRLRRETLQGLIEYSDGRPVLIDKMPLNFRWIGYICAALPEARIVHVSRDTMAVAWSLYRHSFAGGGNRFVYDPADIALHGPATGYDGALAQLLSGADIRPRLCRIGFRHHDGHAGPGTGGRAGMVPRLAVTRTIGQSNPDRQCGTGAPTDLSRRRRLLETL